MKIVERVLPVVLAVIVVLAALNKIASSEFRGDLADSVNMPGWFLIVVGILELFLAMDLLLPRLRVLGGVGVFVVMVGAAIFNALGENVEGTNPPGAIAFVLVLAMAGLFTAWFAAGKPNQLGKLFAAARSQAVAQLSGK